MRRVILFCLLLSGCTVVPKMVVPDKPSLSGNVANSGVISVSDAGYIVDKNWRTRYNKLAQTFDPPCQPDDGLTALPDGTWLVDKQHFGYFELANILSKQPPR